MMGKPVVAGTRITVELILEKMASGESIEQSGSAPAHCASVLAAIDFAIGLAIGHRVSHYEQSA